MSARKCLLILDDVLKEVVKALEDRERSCTKEIQRDWRSC